MDVITFPENLYTTSSLSILLYSVISLPATTLYDNHTLHRGSYMSAHVLLNLLNELGKRDKMRGLPSILSLSQRV